MKNLSVAEITAMRDDISQKLEDVIKQKKITDEAYMRLSHYKVCLNELISIAESKPNEELPKEPDVSDDLL